MESTTMGHRSNVSDLSRTVQRSFIPVATNANVLPDINFPSSSNASSTTNGNPSSRPVPQSQLRVNKAQVRPIRSISKSETSLCEGVSSFLRTHSKSGSGFNEKGKCRPSEEPSDSSMTSSSSWRNATYSSSAHTYAAADIRIKFSQSTKRNAPKTTTSQIIARQNSAILTSVNREKDDQSKNVNASIIQPGPLKGATPVSDSHRKLSYSISLKNGNGGKMNATRGKVASFGKSLSQATSDACDCELQLERQLQEKDLQIGQLLKLASEKESLFDDLYFEMEDKEQQIAELIDEIQKRKQDMAEMSRKIIQMDRQLKAYESARVQLEFSQTNRPFSQLSWDSCPTESQASAGGNKWFKMAPLRTLRKRLNKSKDIEGPTNGECIQELKSILREKEMFITDLRIESKLTSHRIEEMANALRKGEEETLAIKRNNDYLEKAIKSKVLD